MGCFSFKIQRLKSLLIVLIAVIFFLMCIVSMYLTKDGDYIGINTDVVELNSSARVQKERERQYLQNSFIYNKSLGTYLVSITKGLHDGSINESVAENILRSGLGLKPFLTERNEDIWIENGVQYRPFPFLEKKDNPLYTSEFEAYIPFDRSLFFEGDGDKSVIDITEKKIILWWQHKIAHAPIEGLNSLKACPDFPCVVTSDRNYTDKSSALLVNAQFVNGESPPRRRQDQVLINYQIEAPFDYWFYGNLFEEGKGWNNVFNWTMSYRMDADITTFHGLVRKRKVVREKNYTAILNGKKGLVAWMVSNCDTNSKRENYVQELQKYIPVDIYGKCGPYKCPRISDKECLQAINEKYKFYLGFENNLCRDYITEKLYRYLDSDIIVVARAFNTYSRLLPSEIFINTADFRSIKDLADWLLFLDSHDQEYIKMLREKDKYFSLYEDYPLTRDEDSFMEYRHESAPMCELCRRVWNLRNYSKVYPDMSAWMNKEEYQCVVPTDVKYIWEIEWRIIYFCLIVVVSCLMFSYFYVVRKKVNSVQI